MLSSKTPPRLNRDIRGHIGAISLSNIPVIISSHIVDISAATAPIASSTTSEAIL